MRLFWTILLFATQFESCVVPLCELAATPDDTQVIAERLSVRSVIEVAPAGDAVIIISGMDSFPGLEDDRTIWRWSEDRGLEELHSFRAVDIESDRVLPRGESSWSYSFYAKMDGNPGIHVISDDLKPRHAFKLIRHTYFYPLPGDEDRFFLVSYRGPSLMAAGEVKNGALARRWTFPAAPRQGSFPADWTAVPLADGRIALLTTEPPRDDFDPWVLYLRIFGDDEAVEEHLLRRGKPLLAAMTVKENELAIVVRAGEDMEWTVFDVAKAAEAKWQPVARLDHPQPARFPALVAAEDGYVTAWGQPGPIRAVEIPSGLMSLEAGDMREIRRPFLRVRKGRPVLFAGDPALSMRTLPMPLSEFALLERLRGWICDKFAEK
jgi:hypothetical protein